jgi:hypothetical protein
MLGFLSAGERYKNCVLHFSSKTVREVQGLHLVHSIYQVLTSWHSEFRFVFYIVVKMK